MNEERRKEMIRKDWKRRERREGGGKGPPWHPSDRASELLSVLKFFILLIKFLRF